MTVSVNSLVTQLAWLFASIFPMISVHQRPLAFSVESASEKHLPSCLAERDIPSAIAFHIVLTPPQKFASPLSSLTSFPSVEFFWG